MTRKNLIDDLCGCLAFHIVETELTLQHCDGDTSEIEARVAEGRHLIEEAGFDFDTLYPIADRPFSDEIGPPQGSP